MLKLGVNIDHVATLRQARKEVDPDPLAAARVCKTSGADLIVMHEGDLVYKELHENTNFKNNYTLVFAGKFSSVYKKNN